MTIRSGLSLSAERARYYERLARRHLAPLWEFFADWFTPVPRAKSTPYLWSYTRLRDVILQSAQLIDPAEAERRVVVLENPGLSGRRLVTESLYAGLQVIMPGEVAPSHRHSPVALRFVVEGDGAYTAINGERAYMAPGDLIITPPWTWHEHGHEGEGPTVWMDVLDVAMIHLFNASFAELRPGEPAGRGHQIGNAGARIDPGSRPVDSDRDATAPAVFHFSFARMRAELDRLQRESERDACHGFRLEYLDPLTGEPVMPTISTCLHLLPAGFESSPYRTTAGTVFCVVEGSGQVTIGSGDAATVLAYQPWDILVAPSWMPRVFNPATETVVFSASDEIAQKKLGFWREERC